MISFKEKLESAYPVLETKRLILRPVTVADAEDMFEYTNDSRVTAFIQIHNETIEDVKKGIEKHYLADPIGKYGLVLRANHKLIGGIDFRLHEAVCSVELGYVLNHDYQRKGYMHEVIQKCFGLLLMN